MTETPEWLDGASRFPATHVSAIARLRSGEPATREAAFGAVVSGYWKPIYKYLRLKWRLAGQDAEDVTQGFLAAAWEKDWLAEFDPSKARFRTWVRVCLDRYVMNRREAEGALRRGGGRTAVPLDFPGAEAEVALTAPGDDMDALFRQEMIRDLFGRTLADVRAECESRGRIEAFRVFEAYDVSGDPHTTYGEIAARFGIPATQVTNHLAAVRRLFRTRVLDHLRELTGSDEEFHAEARELLGIDVS